MPKLGLASGIASAGDAFYLQQVRVVVHIFTCEFTCSGNALCEANRWGLHGVDAAVRVVLPDRRAGRIHAQIYWSRNGALQLCRVHDAGGVAARPG